MIRVYIDRLLYNDLCPLHLRVIGDTINVEDYGMMDSRWDVHLDSLYSSPEILAFKDYIDARSDVYSLACVPFEMLTGTHPFFQNGYAHESTSAMRGEMKVPKLETMSESRYRVFDNALQFSEKLRTKTVDEFVRQFFCDD